MSERPHFTRDELTGSTSVLYSEPRLVRFQDIDAAGIVFFARVLEYFHDAFVNRLSAVGIALPQMLRDKPWKLPIVHAEADYLGPMRFGDPIVVEVVGVKHGAKSSVLGYRARSEAGHMLAVGQVVHACVDATTFRPIPVPEELMQALTRTPGKPET
ncbi:MAG: acyl-CoA thioesterase [Polyangiaceae bacterium]|nr:acyl-CoA thioesterase [Polyangiaceae bacterium]